MKASGSVAALAWAIVAGASAQTIVRGPIVNPANKSRYYVVQGANWAAIRDFGRAMGGDLATIEDAAENAWVTANLAAPVNNKVWIGLNDATTEGAFQWSDGSTSSYRNWFPGEPANSATADYTQLLNDGGQWAHRTASYTTMGVIEVKGPVLVPQEAATVESALELAQLSTREVLVAAGTFNLTSATTIDTPVTLRGAGRGATVLRSPLSTEAIYADTDLVVRDVTLLTRDILEFIQTNAATTRLIDCDVSSLLDLDARECLEVFGGDIVLERCRVYNTRFLGNAASTSGSIKAVNCTIFNVGSLLDPNGNPSRFTATNCVIHDASGTTLVSDGTEVRLYNTIVSQTTGTWTPLTQAAHCILPAPLLGAGNLVTSTPGFNNAAAGDFALLPGSPAIDTGDIAYYLAAGATEMADLAGLARIRDIAGAGPEATSPIDIGPLEFQGQNTCDDIDFNNDGIFPDTEDINAFIRVFGGGPCQ
ncbi:MAG: C-type lectin domain-containing protein [Phycisphaerales bacterium]